MKILVINCGSSSLKYQLIDMSNEKVLAHGLVERIGIQGSILTQKVEGRDKYIIETPMENHKFAIKLVLDALVDEKHGVIKSMDEINAVGHRVVHGGEKYSQSVIIDENVMKELEDCVKLAPLHNPPNIVGINACKALMPNIPMVAVFDTAFHQTMPEKAYMYAIPYEMYEKHGIRKYGFHGTSHRYVSGEVAKAMGKDIKDLKIITCHLGNGASLAAIKNGECIDTSMGFTPLDGIVMGTRSGSIDPAVVLYMATDLGYSVDEINSILNKKSGVLGLSGISSDFRDLQEQLEKGNERATLALEVFRYSVKKQIGAYIAAMNGVDVIVFTAGLGENSVPNRKAILNGLEYLGIELDEERNDTYGVTKKISKDSSKVDVYVVPTNEELVIARDTLGLIK
ncbi:acetate kinase [Clostridium thermobutyricum]|uniref:Acetate kinase n=1 Tax=Clostridium thermobutyricum DSM 4928 TaxID=1121339 RepID=A0A1V4SZ97_9CLOT|nr:acetate kinase [Clostridium thermobutyricum]OPX51262.1 acetate kinase [Clostridium thermobutyricum DSM 4928]